MFIVVAYDIRNDRRRARLHKKLKNFGNPVQYSVFECVLDERDLRRMRRVVRRLIDEEDSVRYYFLCEACRMRVETAGASRAVTQEPLTVIV